MDPQVSDGQRIIALHRFGATQSWFDLIDEREAGILD